MKKRFPVMKRQADAGTDHTPAPSPNSGTSIERNALILIRLGYADAWKYPWRLYLTAIDLVPQAD